jgi:thioredoxin reductase
LIREVKMHVDVAILGASFAGLSAGVMLARARRRVVLVDDGQTRNRFSHRSHGFLGQDGVTPAAIRKKGLAEVLAYPTASHLSGRVTAVSGRVGAFTLEGPATLHAARVILAYGHRDILPDIPGLEECWGLTANQCPYCHGYELADRKTGILSLGEVVHAHQARHLADWSRDLILLENGGMVDAATAQALDRPGLRRVAGKVSRILQQHGEITAVELEDGTAVPMQALYLHARFEPAAPFARDLGCAMTETPLGAHVTVDAFQRTSVPGVFAAGDLARSYPSAPAAAAAGNLAGAACHQDLLGLLPPR